MTKNELAFAFKIGLAKNDIDKEIAAWIEDFALRQIKKFKIKIKNISTVEFNYPPDDSINIGFFNEYVEKTTRDDAFMKIVPSSGGHFWAGILDSDGVVDKMKVEMLKLNPDKKTIFMVI
jgi:hypothetical protein